MAKVAKFVEQVITKLANAAEEDMELNRQSKPATSKLKMLEFFVGVAEKRFYHAHLFDKGVLMLLAAWLKPLPDGSLPHAMIRSTIFTILLEKMLIDLDDETRKKQLAWSGLGMLVKYFLEHKEETHENIVLTKGLIEKWSYVIFDTGISQSKVVHDETIDKVSSPSKKQPAIAVVEENSGSLPSPKKRRIPPIIAPQPMTMNFSIRPKSREVIGESIMQRGAMEFKRARINKSMK
ncbi:protein IWS1 homolog 1-like [Selaginella moellendorffii]|uniref:protein IWS1 homolog 1-like n=1 Tax=Selaginella moellendorffii TaxID=88036 RepID=UPI000D1C33DB|nr:protein IWS1 homolog 1-like [Selaginella moellendorffii]|eukprot:XP_024523745.1 protein IWS1 homolog 1-like [Selaginella moellendorffii]